MTTPTPPAARAAGPTLPPGAELYQLSVGHYVSHALRVAAELGVSAQLADGPRTVDALAAACGCHAPSLLRVLRLLASVGVYEEHDDGRIAATPLGALLRPDVPGSMRDMVLLFTGLPIQQSWQDLAWCVRSGEPAFRRTDPDGDPFAAMAADPERAALFDRAMAAFAPQTAAAVAAAYDFSRFSRVVDVGGGNGAILVGILGAFPTLRGVVFDQPHVAERARAHVRAAGLAGRCEVVGGSFFDAVVPGADAYLLKHVIHDWDDAHAATILRRCREAMAVGACVLVVEGLYPPRIERSLASRGAASNDVNMLVCTGGRQRSEAEFRALFADAGLRLARIVPTLANVSVIEGEAA